MMYSVWNWNTGRYDYFRGDGPLPGTKAPSRARGSGVGGVRLEDALPLLPRDALKIGTGDDARGQVAVEGRVGSAATAGPGGAQHFQGFGADAVAAATAEPSFFQKNPWTATALLLGGVYVFYKVVVATSKAAW